MFQKGNTYRKGYKMTDDQKKKIGDANRGRKLPLITEVTREKLRKANRGRKLSQKHIERLKEFNTGRKMLDETKEKLKLIVKKKWQDPEYRKKLSKENSSNWKGGITLLNQQIRECYKYFQWRSDVFIRDNFTCQECFARGIYLHAHHIEELNKLIKKYNIKTLNEALNCIELWNTNNGITYCERCHKPKHLKKN